MVDVFLSYAREDVRTAERLAQCLSSAGLSVWWDAQIRAGSTFDEQIEQELLQAGAVVVLWSTHSVISSWVKNEAMTGLERSVLIPVSIEQIRQPLAFRHIQAVSLIGWNGDLKHAAYRALETEIKRLVSAEPEPTRVSIKPLRSEEPPQEKTQTRETVRSLYAAILAVTAVSVVLLIDVMSNRMHATRELEVDGGLEEIVPLFAPVPAADPAVRTSTVTPKLVEPKHVETKHVESKLVEPKHVEPKPVAPRAVKAKAKVPSSAQSTTRAAKVLILPYQCLGKGVPSDLAEQATVVISKEMAQSGLTIIRADDLREVETRTDDTPTGDPDAEVAAKALLASGMAAVEREQAEAGGKTINAAVTLLADNADALPDLSLLVNAYIQLGVAHARNGDEAASEAALAKAVHLDPERELSSAEFPNLFISLYNRTRSIVLRRQRSTIEVSAALGAQVLLDGRKMGKAPLVLEQVLPGDHWIRIERPGEFLQVKKIAVRANRSLLVEFEGAPASSSFLEVLQSNDLSRRDVQHLQAAGARAQVDFVMIGATYRTSAEYVFRTVYVRVTDGAVGRLADIAFDLDMLSAEIEVYRLAADAKKQATSGKLERIVIGDRFSIAPDFKEASAKRTVPRIVTAPGAPSE
jgi:hypothetical protein